jgi:hypothetical protein
MEPTFNLASAGNTGNPCLFILRNKGYEVKLVNIADERCLYVGFKQGRRFVGDSALELLGLVTLWEHFGDDWRAQSANLPNLYENLPVEERGNSE